MRKSKRGSSVDSVFTAAHSMVEPLESRVFLSAGLSRGVLKITGTSSNDHIQVALNGTKKIAVSEGSAVKNFDRAKVKSINIVTGDGSDHVEIFNGIKQQVTIKLGEGDDSVHGGSGREIIFGGNGNDTVHAGGGSDFVSGEGGDDLIEGDAGGDYLYGDAGNDVIRGGAGNDVMAGDLENKLVTKGVPPLLDQPGNDSLDGGDGNDWMLSERRYLGGTTFARNGADVFTGGAGNDTIDIGMTGQGEDDIITDEEPGDFVPLQEYTAARELPGDVHTHVLLWLRVKSGAKYRTALVQPDLGRFAPSGERTFANLHTHEEPSQDQFPHPVGSNIIHYEAAANSPAYRIGSFFQIAGISFDAWHIGRSIAPVGKKITMLVTPGTGRQFRTTAFGKYMPVGNRDSIEIRVG